MSVIKIIGIADGGPGPFDGQYVKEYDPGRDRDLPNGDRLNCWLVTTPDRGEALELNTAEALELWRKVDPRQPYRADGRPNRPLTAFTVEVTK